MLSIAALDCTKAFVLFELPMLRMQNNGHWWSWRIHATTVHAGKHPHNNNRNWVTANLNSVFGPTECYCCPVPRPSHSSPFLSLVQEPVDEMDGKVNDGTEKSPSLCPCE